MFTKSLIVFLFVAGMAFGQSADSYSNKMYFDREQVRKFTDTDTLFQPSNYNLETSIKSGGLKCGEKCTLKDILLMEGAVATYGTLDYIGYNVFKNGGEEQWRFCQGLLFAGFNYALTKLASKKAALGFSLQVWGGLPDMVYYGIDKIGGGFGGFSNGNELNPHKNLKHLNFMPTVIGSDKVRLSDLITNNLLSFAVAIAINL